MIAIRALAWDLDGTLVDSESLHHHALVATCQIYSVDLSDLPDQAFRGLHVFDVWTRLRPRLPQRLDRREWLEGIDQFYIENSRELVAMPESLETIAALAARGVAQACVSNSSRAVVDANIAALGIAGQIAFSISLDDVTVGKPDPEPYSLAARRFGCPATEIAAVEDSSVGAASARAAGLVVVRYAPNGEREGVGDVWLSELSELLRFVASPSVDRQLRRRIEEQ
jgi:HAD superfamily hydrolase (TIGR01509 family)